MNVGLDTRGNWIGSVVLSTGHFPGFSIALQLHKMSPLGKQSEWYFGLFTCFLTFNHFKIKRLKRSASSGVKIRTVWWWPQGSFSLPSCAGTQLLTGQGSSRKSKCWASWNLNLKFSFFSCKAILTFSYKKVSCSWTPVVCSSRPLLEMPLYWVLGEGDAVPTNPS